MDIDKWTDSELERLEKRIAEQYKQAQEELSETAHSYFSEYADRFKREELAMLTTSLTKDEVETKWVDLYGTNSGFERWYKGADHAYGQTESEAKLNFRKWEIAQLGRGQHWNDMRDQMAQRLTETNQIASGYINNILPSIYMANSNGVAAIFEKAAMNQGMAGVKFDLVDEYTVRNLMTQSSEVRPYKPVKISIDESTKWSKNKLQNALLQGILQGDSIDQIADRFETVTGMNRNAAIRNARTATTNARNAGKQDRFEELKAKGCIFTKIWVATRDDRTRTEHMDANGQEVDSDSTFDVGGEDLMYPADPSASGWNRYNCRCTMKTGKIRFTSNLSDEQRKKAKISVVSKFQNLSATFRERPDYYDKLPKPLQRCVDYLVEHNDGVVFADYDKQYVQAINNVVANCNNTKVKNLWNKMQNALVIGGDEYPGGALVDAIDKRIYFNKAKDIIGDKYEKPYAGFLHEAFHVFDDAIVNANDDIQHSLMYEYKNGLLYKTARSEYDEFVKGFEKKAKLEFMINQYNYDWLYKKGFIKEFEYNNYKTSGKVLMRKVQYTPEDTTRLLGYYLSDMDSQDVYIISDLIDGITNKKVNTPYGHANGYWNKRRVCSEFGANMYGAMATNSNAVNVAMKHFPKTTSLYAEILESM